MFYLKKLISHSLLPIPIVLLLLLIAIFCLYSKRLQRAGKLIVIVAFLILFFISFPITSSWFIEPLEFQYPVLLNPPKEIHYIVVLGGGNLINPGMPSTDLLSSSTLSRLIEGMRLHRLIPNSQLILSGGSYYSKKTDADSMAQAALTLGIKNHTIILEKQSWDTYQEAMYLKPLLGQQQFILVTSGVHMPRAMRLFQKLGMHPIAAPCDFHTFNPETPTAYFPSGANIVTVESAEHEYLGLIAAKITGKI